MVESMATGAKGVVIIDSFQLFLPPDMQRLVFQLLGFLSLASVKDPW